MFFYFLLVIMFLKISLIIQSTMFGGVDQPPVFTGKNLFGKNYNLLINYLLTWKFDGIIFAGS